MRSKNLGFVMQVARDVRKTRKRLLNGTEPQLVIPTYLTSDPLYSVTPLLMDLFYRRLKV